MKNTRHFISDLETLICIQRLFREYCRLVVGLVYITALWSWYASWSYISSVVVCFVANPRCQLVDFPGAILCDENVSLHQNDAAIFGGEELTSDQGGATRFVFVCKNSIGSMGLVYIYIYLHLPCKSTKCRSIYHTWMVWERILQS